MFNLTEGAAAPQKTAQGNWRAVLITPGKGSSGIYTESMLREHGPKVFTKGTHSYVDHPVTEDEVRSPKNLMGVLAEDAHYEDGVGLVAEIEVMNHWREFVEAVAPHTGLSIYANGEGSYNDEGDLVVESLIPNRMTSVDLVAYAGRPGSGLAEKLYESAIAAGSNNGTVVEPAAATKPNMEEGNLMTLEEIKGLLDDALAPIVDRLTVIEETLKPATDPMATEELDVAAVAEAMVAAGLPEVSRKAVYESLKNGVDVNEAIESQKAFVESVKSHLAESAPKVAEVAAEVVVEESAKRESLAGILNVKVGA